MRSAEVSQFWDQLRGAKHHPPIINRVEIKNVIGLADCEITFDGPITALCGLNGVGKSTILRAIWAVVGSESSFKTHLAGFEERLTNANIEVELTINNSLYKRSFPKEDINDNALPTNLEFFFMDAPRQAASMQRFFREIEDIDSVLDPLSPASLKASELKVLNYISGKPYCSAEIFEINEFDEPLLFFRVSIATASYDIRSMSLGEISCLYLYWSLRETKRSCIFLVEEPETYISPVAQEYMMDFFAERSLKKDSSFFIATHSPNLIKKLKYSELRIIYSSNSGSKIAPIDKNRNLGQQIGLKADLRSIIFVEDRLARETTNFLLPIRHRSFSSM